MSEGSSSRWIVLAASGAACAGLGYLAYSYLQGRNASKSQVTWGEYEQSAIRIACCTQWVHEATGSLSFYILIYVIRRSMHVDDHADVDVSMREERV